MILAFLGLFLYKVIILFFIDSFEIAIALLPYLKVLVPVLLQYLQE